MNTTQEGILTSSTFGKVCQVSQFDKANQRISFYYDRREELGYKVSKKLSPPITPFQETIFQSGRDKETQIVEELRKKHPHILFIRDTSFIKDNLSTRPDLLCHIQTQFPTTTLEKHAYHQLKNKNATFTIEIKTRFFKTAHPHQELPLNYWLQVLGEIHLSESEFGYLISQSLYNGYSLFYIQRNDIAWNEIKSNLLLPYVELLMQEEEEEPLQLSREDELFIKSLFVLYMKESVIKLV